MRRPQNEKIKIERLPKRDPFVSRHRQKSTTLLLFLLIRLLASGGKTKDTIMRRNRWVTRESTGEQIVDKNQTGTSARSCSNLFIQIPVVFRSNLRISNSIVLLFECVEITEESSDRGLSHFNLETNRGLSHLVMFSDGPSMFYSLGIKKFLRRL